MAAIFLASVATAAGPDDKTAHDIFKQLIEINTTDSVGSTSVAAHPRATSQDRVKPRRTRPFQGYARDQRLMRLPQALAGLTVEGHGRGGGPVLCRHRTREVTVR